jgi:hypothetical protein
MRVSLLLSIIARIHPEAWDFIVAHTPAVRPASAAERQSLNPQPLPPREAFVAGAAELAHELVRQAVVMEATGGAGASFVIDEIDDWCGSGWPRHWPFPWPGPHRDGDGIDPDWITTGTAVAAIVFASAAARMSEGELHTAFAAGADRLAGAAVGEAALA